MDDNILQLILASINEVKEENKGIRKSVGDISTENGIIINKLDNGEKRFDNIENKIERLNMEIHDPVLTHFTRILREHGGDIETMCREYAEKKDMQKDVKKETVNNSVKYVFQGVFSLLTIGGAALVAWLMSHVKP